ncbi:hypothetical protein DT73_13050 [Mangrovibacter sp. MFB070]|uniref:hypothetical protein n=1 Tax=Mangrovibacter sp. MFB070 TaxID=1224318 RepID=UPI0004D58D69|nr:hypothetical protein [Mangrovibacter sp. MFB070]KEA51856.1 hypothetical protein DT73_13050 [Mangrovibacter sp. MFB070]
MEWIITVFATILLPICFFLYTTIRDRRKDMIINENRFASLESRLTLQEQKLETMVKDINEIEKVLSEITELKISIAKIITILEERNK